MYSQIRTVFYSIFIYYVWNSRLCLQHRIAYGKTYNIMYLETITRLRECGTCYLKNSRFKFICLQNVKSPLWWSNWKTQIRTTNISSGRAKIQIYLMTYTVPWSVTNCTWWIRVKNLKKSGWIGYEKKHILCPECTWRTLSYTKCWILNYNMGSFINHVVKFLGILLPSPFVGNFTK